MKDDDEAWMQKKSMIWSYTIIIDVYHFGRLVTTFGLKFAKENACIHVNVQSFSKWLGKCAAYPTSLSENLMYRHTSIMSSKWTMSSKGIMSNLFFFGWWRGTMWLTAFPNTSWLSQSTPLDFGHWSDDCSTSHPGSFLHQKEIFLLTGWACGGSSYGLPYSKKPGVC